MLNNETRITGKDNIYVINFIWEVQKRKLWASGILYSELFLTAMLAKPGN